MAYVAPTTRANGYVVDASEWNQSVVDNVKYLKDAPTFDGAVTASSTLTVANNAGIAATKKLYLDGVAMSGDTYISESASNVLSLYSGGVESKLTSGVLTVSGFGTHTFSAGSNGAQILNVTNTTSDTAALSRVTMVAGSATAQLTTYAQGYTTSGTSIAASSRWYADGAGGISVVADNASGAIRFYSGGTTQYMQLGTTGRLSLGTSFTEYGRLNVANTTSQDLLFLKFTNTPATASQFITFLNSAGSTAGYISMNSGDAAVTYSTSSDERLKHDDGIVADASSVLKNTKVHDFRWRNDGTSRGRNVFAQEAMMVNPRAVTMGKDDALDDRGLPLHPWMVDKTEYVPDLIVGWQQHDATIQQLAARIAALEAAQESK